MSKNLHIEKSKGFVYIYRGHPLDRGRELIICLSPSDVKDLQEVLDS